LADHALFKFVVVVVVVVVGVGVVGVVTPLIKLGNI
jgi:hypothetical protein